ncbi:protein phosphatase 2C domain-containing protein [Sphingomonas sp. SUN019]|uniref:PP2C family protein-serine/threonine phosphatase n=1 Tax=Sphingomonas sp. SUN019 TaxID=2937788 RepID=UPI002164D811|nr:protein phosphatase 2C domain-containing protein [Sphingomonas sp. SUN019]UVO50478.1 protein phosphatase 2C domain-containing protein [Sphingomonas sp. SUN019]
MSALLRRWSRTRAAPTFTAVSRTHVGRVRQVNEDRLLDRTARGLWAIADGMGGHRAGDVAAGIAIDTLAALADTGALIDESAVTTALSAANAAIIAATGDTDTSGTTIVAATPTHVLWVGDSRAYRIRDERLTPLTRDHSVVQELIDAGLLSPADAPRHPRANVITRALGIGAAVEIERARIELLAGDLLLLCSDGLSRSLDPRDFIPGRPLEAQADRLLTNALQRDGSDNASLILVAVG